jgi:oligopeptide transport system permease protein
MQRLLTGDLGESFHYKNTSVNDIIRAHAPYSFLLGGLALLTALIMAIPLGISAAPGGEPLRPAAPCARPLFRQHSRDRVGAARHPLFCLRDRGAAGRLVGGAAASGSACPHPRLPFAARLFLLTREKAHAAFHSEYARAAIARGVSMRRLRYTHILKNSLIPVVAYLAPGSAALLTGSIVVETIYVLPGLGKYFVQSAFNRDYF